LIGDDQRGPVPVTSARLPTYRPEPPLCPSGLIEPISMIEQASHGHAVPVTKIALLTAFPLLNGRPITIKKVRTNRSRGLSSIAFETLVALVRQRQMECGDPHAKSYASCRTRALRQAPPCPHWSDSAAKAVPHRRPSEAILSSPGDQASPNFAAPGIWVKPAN
jgi:hypothetical protein